MRTVDSTPEEVRGLGLAGECGKAKPRCQRYTCSLTPIFHQSREAVALSISHNQLIAGLAHSNRSTAGG